MTPEEIQADKNSRIDSCKKELEATLGKYNFALSAEDYITPNVKISLQFKFIDLKDYSVINLPTTATSVPTETTTQGQSLTMPTAPGVQADGSVIIDSKDLV